MVLQRRLAGDEDWLPQNHMVSVVSMRPQILRRVLAYFVTAGARLALQAIVKDGYLGSMRTIHFAHWAFVNNGSRMLFLSNYDFSWETYFDDFIVYVFLGFGDYFFNTSGVNTSVLYKTVQ